MRLSNNFTLAELEASSKAKQLGIDNTLPRTPFMLHNAKALAERLQLIRDALNAPLLISGGYRCRALNVLIGGVDTSQHVIGLAADIYTPDMTAQQL